jgi:4-hydroxy-tetrahydrodipicolinate reductase
MGTAVSEVAIERRHEVAFRFDEERPLPENQDALAGVDVAVDFSLPELAPTHIERYCRWRVPAVIGTTGWYDRLDDVRAWVSEHDASLFYAPNFSIGVALLAGAIRAVTPLVDKLSEYDAYIHEVHHVNKLDSPSGTALMLAEILTSGVDRKSHVEVETQHGPIAAKALHVSSSRAGGVFGKHTVAFDSPFDELAFSHQAKNRKGFAFGAVRAAEWLPGKQGLYTLDDLLGEWIGSATQRATNDPSNT